MKKGRYDTPKCRVLNVDNRGRIYLGNAYRGQSYEVYRREKPDGTWLIEMAPIDGDNECTQSKLTSTDQTVPYMSPEET